MLQELSHMDRITQLQNEIEQLLTIMAASIQYLSSKTNFEQVSAAIPITKQRNVEKMDPPDVFEANKAELVADIVSKAKQVEVLIKSLPVPESEESQALRFQELEEEMQEANQEYITALNRAKDLHGQMSEALREMLSAPELPVTADDGGS
ncbi:uncharacterized protein FOMMEDRAFT_19736 [Fomitiporia mediterranea MF3/22]|uniref:uncharacterized protein n=1 Tax=Fomitiporia mediterranea (strain MF3/22) TaxID=694068 RepID=UPI0004407542|nr:uncharacterized protein FOMMEDRAFT_19736 [Fomitiporia mediterranea MF3/22]EJD04529.1 hypothetical protein FOMMEDRAFT_19736 [Fomitiporia mediterranea MF3/22]